MFAVALLLATVNPDFYLPLEKFDDKHLSHLTQLLTTLHSWVADSEKQVAIAFDRGQKQRTQLILDLNRELLETWTNELVNSRRELRSNMLLQRWKALFEPTYVCR